MVWTETEWKYLEDNQMKGAIKKGHLWVSVDRMIDAECSRHKGPIIDTAGLSKVLEGMDIP